MQSAADITICLFGQQIVGDPDLKVKACGTVGTNFMGSLTVRENVSINYRGSGAVLPSLGNLSFTADPRPIHCEDEMTKETINITETNGTKTAVPGWRINEHLAVTQVIGRL